VCVCVCVQVRLVCPVSTNTPRSAHVRSFIAYLKNETIQKFWNDLLVVHTSPSVVKIFLCDETGRSSLINLFIFSVIKFLWQQDVHYCGAQCNVYCVMCNL
jgi:hypothetical protein